MEILGLKNTRNVTQNLLEGLTNRCELAEKRIIELECRSNEVTQCEKQRGKKNETNQTEPGVISGNTAE